MNISLDYDNTYTRDPAYWDKFIALTRQYCHTVYCVTMRYPSEGDDVIKNLEGKVSDIFFTSRQAKKDFMFSKGICIDVWIDDMPFFIDNSAIS